MTSTITTERHYAHSIDKVWRAITEPELVSRWLMPTDIRAEIGHRFTLRTDPYPGFDGTVRGEVLRIDPPHLFSYRWSGGGLRDTVVTFRLEAMSATSTRLHFEHSGFEGLLNRLITRNVLALGWRGKLLGERLPQLLDDL